MPKDAPPNGGALPEDGPIGQRRRVSEMQAKLHRPAAADPGRSAGGSRAWPGHLAAVAVSVRSCFLDGAVVEHELCHSA